MHIERSADICQRWPTCSLWLGLTTSRTCKMWKMCKIRKISSSLQFSKVANMLSVAGADHIITMDLHASQIQVFVLIVAVVTVVVVILVICVSVDCWSC